MAETVLEVRDLHTAFFTHTGVVPALRGVNLTVNEGEIVGVVGESGAGKSVLARSILHLVKTPGRVVKGHILFQGQDLLKKSDKEMQYLRGRKIALIVSNPRAQLNPLLHVGAQIANMIRANKEGVSAQAAERQVLELISAVGIGDPPRVARAYPHELSGGMCQRILIAMALSNNPKLLLADEPTNGLDVTVQRQVLELMRDLVRDHKAATLIATRDLGIVAHYCQRVIVLERGEIIEAGEVRSFFSNPQHPHSRSLLAKTFAAVGTNIGGMNAP
jgi:ABC-type dipeptide/oligopeptide/nickel transport system ATPase component